MARENIDKIRYLINEVIQRMKGAWWLQTAEKFSDRAPDRGGSNDSLCNEISLQY